MRNELAILFQTFYINFMTISFFFQIFPIKDIYVWMFLKQWIFTELIFFSAWIFCPYKRSQLVFLLCFVLLIFFFSFDIFFWLFDSYQLFFFNVVRSISIRVFFLIFNYFFKNNPLIIFASLILVVHAFIEVSHQ